MTSNTREWAANADEQSMSDRLLNGRRGAAGLGGELGEIDEVDETLNKAGISAHRRPRAGELSDLDLARLTERPRPELKTYAPGEVTPLDALLETQSEAPVADAITLDAEVARLQAVVDRLEADISKTEARLDELDASRGDVVLNGGNIEELHKGLRDAEMMVKTLGAGVAPAKAMLAKAKTASRKAALERQAVATKAEHYGPAAEAFQTMFKLLAGVCHTAKLLDEHAIAIEGANQRAQAAGRADLVIDMKALRRAVVDTIGTQRVDNVEPERMGETDTQFEARLWAVVATNAKTVLGRGKTSAAANKSVLADCRAMHIEQGSNEDNKACDARRWASAAIALHVLRADSETEAEYRDRLREALARRLSVQREGESDEAYTLRVANARAMAGQARDTSDPLRAIGEKAIVTIKTHVLGLDKAALNNRFPDMVKTKPMPGDTFETLRLRRR